MIACYDLHRRLPTFDFFNWLCHVKLLGAREITIDTTGKLLMRKKWPRQETLNRVDSFLLPGVQLAGLRGRLGTDGDRFNGSHMTRDLWWDAQLRRSDIPRLRSVHPARSAKYTVTLRDTFHRPERNSDRAVWLAFAQEIGAKVIDDTAKQPIGLFERVAWYAGAEMNFGIPNGPLCLLYYTEFPFRVYVDPDVNGVDFKRQGHADGDQLPWFRDNQRLVWQKPTLEVLLSDFERVAA